MEELVVRTVKTCSCHTQDTFLFQRTGEEVKLYVNGFLLYRDLNKIREFVSRNSRLFTKEDYERLLRFLDQS